MVVFLEKIGDTRCYIWDAEASKIWDVIKTDMGIRGISIVGSVLVVLTS
jgi:hypothetical protein